MDAWVLFCFYFYPNTETLQKWCSTDQQKMHFKLVHCRYIAVTQPIKYAKHKNSLRIFITILLVWVISIAIGSPIVLGLNNTTNRPLDMCGFFNPNFIIFSSLVSFYIPCIIMVFLYWSIFKVSLTALMLNQVSDGMWRERDDVAGKWKASSLGSGIDQFDSFDPNEWEA